MNNHLLIVDDEDRMTRSFKVLFENQGYQVKTADNGPDAIDTFRQFPSKVVISDIQMDQMNGIQMMQKLTQLDPCIQVIFLTAYSSVQNAAEALKYNNAFEYLAKPVQDMDALYHIADRARKKYDLEKNLQVRNRKTQKGFANVKTIFDSMEACVYVADMQSYELLYANQKFLETFYEGKAFPKGKKCWQVFQKNQSGPCPFCTNHQLDQEHPPNGQPYEWEFKNPENHCWYNMVDKSIKWLDTRVVKMVTAFDITEKKENEFLYRTFEKAIETSKKLESISTLAGGVAHDFNNSLSTVIGNINLAQLSCSDSETQKYLANAERAIIQAKGISGKLINFAKGTGPVRTRTRIKQMIQGILKKELDDSPITYAIESDAIPDQFHADQSQLKDAFRNILLNAIESINREGKITVSIRFRESRLQNSQIFITISDTGCGIPKEHLDMIFNPYFTTKPLGNKKSTGLGLSIAWSIIARHGGQIHVDSTQGKGTSVHILLPVFKETLSEDTASQKADPDPGRLNISRSQVRILVMDDDELILDVISKLLGRLGYETIAALNSDQAQGAFKTALQQGNKIHIALLDYDMKDGPGGFTTMKKLQKLSPDTKGILITGHMDDEKAKTYASHGFSSLIEKPFSIKQLNDKIRDLIQTVQQPS